MSIAKTPEPAIPEFLARPPETPMLDETWKAVVKNIDDIINGAIYAVGDKFGNALSALKEVKTPLVSLGSGSLAGDISSAPSLTPSITPRSSEKGESPQREHGLGKELQIAMEKSGPSSHSMGLKCEHCDRGDSGLLASPYTPSLGANRSQGMALG